MYLKAPRSADGVVGGGVACWVEGNLDRTGVVEEAHNVGVGGRGVARNFSESPQGVLGFVPKVRADRKNGILEALGPHVARDTGVSRGIEAVASSSGEFSLGGADAPAAVQAVGLAVLVGCTRPI